MRGIEALPFNWIPSAAFDELHDFLGGGIVGHTNVVRRRVMGAVAGLKYFRFASLVLQLGGEPERK